MHITIAERFRPFSHAYKTVCILPQSDLRFEIFPAQLFVSDLSKATPKPCYAIPLVVNGPVTDFTVMQDLEKGCLKVWGRSQKGYFRYRIDAAVTEAGFTITIEKSDDEAIFSQVPQGLIAEGTTKVKPEAERLSFGVTKKADWTLVDRRSQLSEILPFWFRLGQLTPSVSDHAVGTVSLFHPLESAFDSRDRLAFAKALKNLYLAGFEGMLACSLEDVAHHGFSLPQVPENCDFSPLLLLTKGATFIKRMLVNLISSDTIDILPCLIPELHAGRYCNVVVGDIGTLDLEWSKKQARRMIFSSEKDQTVTFNFQKDLNSFRMRPINSQVATTKACGEAITFAKGVTYFFDNFKH